MSGASHFHPADDTLCSPQRYALISRARVWWKVIKQGNALYWKGTTSLDLRLREHPINMAYEAARVELAGGEIVAKPSRRVEKLLKELGI